MISSKPLSVLLITYLLLNSCTSENNDAKERNIENTVFQRITSSYSGIEFSNNLNENLQTKENLFDFDYFYNGGGVGLEDLNNDGLLDIFLCGNQVPNQLYLNKGNLKFTEISEHAKINKGKNWSNGITFADVNGDGYKDIYISQGGPKKREHRKNLLYINNKNLTFTESATKYGLADDGISTQSAFFDYDNDGDLDCIVMNENEIYGVDPINLYKLVANSDDNKHYNSSHLYRNDNGKYVNVTKEAGIERPIFGLGLCVSDINKDGWLDFYIASDYYIPDVIFINNKNGTFTDQVKNYTNQISYYGMGIDIADINNDLKEDIFVLDMSSSDHIRAKTLMASMDIGRFNFLTKTAEFQFQYMYNSLQLNIGNNLYNNISQLTKTANTDWSWSVLMSDFDNDEDKDIYISNGYRRYALDNDLQNKVFKTQRKYNRNVPLKIKKQLYEAMPSEKLKNILFSNDGNLKFSSTGKLWGLDDYSFSNGVAQGDLDNDGDLDLVVNNIDEEVFLYKNTTSDYKKGNFLKIKTKGATSEPFCNVTIKSNGKTQFLEQKRVRGYMSAQENTMIFGLGKNKRIDTLIVKWLDGTTENIYDIKANTTLELNIKKAHHLRKNNSIDTKLLSTKIPNKELNLQYTHKENYFDDFAKEILLPYKQSTFGPFISKGDVNNDGLMDILIGGASGQPTTLYIQKDKKFKKIKSKVFEDDKMFEDMESIFFDFDNDNDLDLYIVSGGNEHNSNSSYYQDRIYINDGLGNYTRHTEHVLTTFTQNGKTVKPIDFDNDGDQDLVIGNRSIPNKYPQHSNSILYENKKGFLVDVTAELAPELINFGIINSIISTDINNDGWQDFIAVGEWTGIGIFKNTGGKFSLIKTPELLNEKGLWFSVNETDVNNDGYKDYIIGNIGHNFKFKTSKEKPFKIFSNDFDNNGTNDIVLSKSYKGSYVPVRGRECSSQQMPFIKNKFKTYSDFANATLNDIYGENLDSSYSKEANTFSSVILINDGNEQFSIANLPAEAQQFPIMKSVFYDINNDGFKDCIIAGNIYDMEVETPRLDAISGVVLISDQISNYTSLDYEKSGIYLKGDVKDLIILEIAKNPTLISTINNDTLGIFRLPSKYSKLYTREE